MAFAKAQGTLTITLPAWVVHGMLLNFYALCPAYLHVHPLTWQL